MFLFIFWILLSMRYKREDNTEYLSVSQTNVWKGIFLFFVFVRHFLQYGADFSNHWYDKIGITMDKKGGQLLVVMFLFYSGYGVMESFKKKGREYVRKMPVRRILPTLGHFDAVVILYAVVTILLGMNEFDVKKLILSLTGWDTYGNSNWYIFVILCLYIFTFIALSVSDGNKAVGILFLETVLFVFILSRFKQPYWYNTVFAYVFGCLYSVNREKIEAKSEKTKKRSFIPEITFFAALAVFAVCYTGKSNMYLYFIHTLAFAAMILAFSRRFYIQNSILELAGKCLFPLYIFQRLPMIVLSRSRWMLANPYMFFAVALVFTIILAAIYEMNFSKAMSPRSNS